MYSNLKNVETPSFVIFQLKTESITKVTQQFASML